MMLELHNISIAPHVRNLSLTVDGGRIAGITGVPGRGKTSLLRAVMGFIPVDGGHISIDGELMTPLSAPYFRRQTAYVPQYLSLPDGYEGWELEQWSALSVDERYLMLLSAAVRSGKPLLVVDEPPSPVADATRLKAAQLLGEAAGRGSTVLAVNPRTSHIQIEL